MADLHIIHVGFDALLKLKHPLLELEAYLKHLELPEKNSVIFLNA
ncbi:hypothetical protein BvCmsKSP081_04132 [Escherichia coli]|nr:hypothetical protein BvCmsKSP081_04132 [Escherichia coli]